MHVLTCPLCSLRFRTSGELDTHARDDHWHQPPVLSTKRANPEKPPPPEGPDRLLGLPH